MSASDFFSLSNNSDSTSPDGTSRSQSIAPLNTGANPNDPSSIRLSMSGLFSGATQAFKSVAGQVIGSIDARSSAASAIKPESDWRVRISMQPFSSFYKLSTTANNSIMSPLVETNGVVFPYTPNITITHNARYGTTQLTHSNYSSFNYEGSEVAAITIAADFTVQNISEGQYLMAVIQFFRSCTKMFYGNEPLAGTPPPLVFLDGYGSHYLPHIPCVVMSFQHTMPADVDYLAVPIGVDLKNIQGNALDTNLTKKTYLPTMSSLSVTLQPVYSKNNVARNFTLEKFAAGSLARSGSDITGGFL